MYKHGVDILIHVISPYSTKPSKYCYRNIANKKKKKIQ